MVVLVFCFFFADPTPFPFSYGGKPPHEYVASYRLEYDMSWTPVEKMAQRDERRRLDPQLLGLTNSQQQQNGSNPLRLTFA